jgi:DHA2 family multidrug resistance protein-like MFS transporter
MAVGCLVAASGFSFLIFLNGQSDLITLVTGFTVFSLGCSPVFTLATDVVVGSAPPQKAGIASSLSETSSELGGAMGIAILGSIGTLVYKQGLKNATIPDAISADTLGGVVASLSQGSGPQSGYFLDLARQSFVAGLNLAAAIAALISLILAVLCVVVLRNN